MKTTRLSQLLILTVALSGLAACGGGGGGDAAPPPANPTPTQPPPVNGMPPFPLEAQTGLSYPSKTLQLTTAQAADLVETAVSTYKISGEARAAVQLGQEAPGALANTPSPAACSGGGAITYVLSAGKYDYAYAGCQSGAFTYNGGPLKNYMTLGSGSYAITYDDLVVTGGWDGTIDVGTTNCKIEAGVAKCVATVKGFIWGFDHTFDKATAIANGTHQCNCNNAGTWNVVFENFGPTSGKAYVYATNGGAIITRTGATTFTVELTVNSVTTSFPVSFNG